MRAATMWRGLLIAGIALVPVACGDDSPGTASASPDTTAHAEHSDHTGQAETARATAPPSTAAAPARLDVVATEYEWSGVPDELAAGTYPVSFRNDGTEIHEISIFRNPDHVPLDELHELGPAGIGDAVQMAGTLLAAPGSTADRELTITLEPGEYEVVCFLPATSDGKAHFQHGMHRTLTVVEDAS